MNITMEWNNLNFKGSHLVGAVVLLVPIITFLVKIDSKSSLTLEKQEEMRTTQMEFVKDYYIDREAMRNQINAQAQEIKMQGLRIEMLEKAINKK